MKPFAKKVKHLAQFFLFNLLSVNAWNLEAAIPASERAALIDLYNSTNGPGWKDHTGWLDAIGTECSWKGVQCDANGPNENVSIIDLGGNLLSGSVPSSMDQLGHLQLLNLGRNQLSGSIPGSIGLLSNLQSLFLNDNLITGSIPANINQLRNLQTLSLGRNQLSGNIPSSFGQLSQLQYLSLDENQLSGSIPSSLGQLSNLQLLALYKNQLSGSIPDSLGQLSNLLTLLLYDNQLSGSIPESLGQLSKLWYLRLDGNQLSAKIPNSLLQLSNLSKDTYYPDNELSFYFSLSSNHCLTTDNAALVAFIDKFDPSWKTTQGTDCPFPADNSKALTAETFSLSPENGTAPLTVSLDASQLAVNDAQSAQYAWRSSDGQSVNGKTASLSFQQAGIYDILLTVTENGATTLSRSRQVIAAPQTQLASASFAEPNDNQQSASPLLVNDSPAIETLDQSDSQDWFEFYAKAGQGYTVEIPAGSIGRAIHPAIQVFDAQGNSLSQVQQETQSDSGIRLSLTATYTGLYRVSVTNQDKQSKSLEVDSQYQLRVYLTDAPQQGIIKGFALNSCNQQGLAEAEVSSLLNGAVTDSTFTYRTGEFGLPLNPNAYQLNGVKEAYGNQQQGPLQVAADTIVRANLSMTPTSGCGSIINVDPLTVSQQAVATYDDKSGRVVIRDVWAGDYVYYAELQDIGNYRFQLVKALQIGGTIHALPGSYDFDTKIAQLPTVFGLGKSWKVELKNDGNWVFDIVTAKEN